MSVADRAFFALPLVVCGCAADPPAQADAWPATPQTADGGALAPELVADTLLAAVPPSRWRALRLAIEPDASLPPDVAASLVWDLRPALGARVALEAGADDLEALSWHRAALEARPPAPTHLVRVGARHVEQAWEVHWRLVEVATGLEVSTAAQRVRQDDLAPAPVEADPLAATRLLLAAARRGDGERVARLLHPELAQRWTRLARGRQQTLEQFALQPLTTLLAEHGAPRDLDLHGGALRAKVDVRFDHKLRDVDFRWRAGPRGWRLYSIDDL